MPMVIIFGHSMRSLALLSVFAFLCFYSRAQPPLRAQKYFANAMRLDAQKKHAEAREEMEKAIKEYPSYTDAYSMLGAWYFQDHRFDKAAEIFGKAYRNIPRSTRLFAYPYAKSLVYSGKPEEAIPIINNVAANNDEWKKLGKQAAFVQQSLHRKWKDTAFNMGPAINTSEV